MGREGGQTSKGLRDSCLTTLDHHVDAGLDVLSYQAANLQQNEPGADVEGGIQRLRKKEKELKETSLWHPLTQDRRIELVFIGDGRMQQDAIRAALEDAMLTQGELREFQDSWNAGALPQAPSLNPFANVPMCKVSI